MPDRLIIAYLLIAAMIVAIGLIMLTLRRQRRERRRALRTRDYARKADRRKKWLGWFRNR